MFLSTEYSWYDVVSATYFVNVFGGPLQSTLIQYNTTVQSSLTQSSAVQSSPVQSNPFQSNLIQFSLVQSNPVQYSPIQFSPFQFNAVRFSLLLVYYNFRDRYLAMIMSSNIQAETCLVSLLVFVTCLVVCMNQKYRERTKM